MQSPVTRAAPLLALAITLAPTLAPTLAHAETAEGDRTFIVTAPADTDAAELRAAKTPGGADIVPPEDYADKSIVSLRSEEHTSELQSLMRISYAVFCLQKKTH